MSAEKVERPFRLQANVLGGWKTVLCFDAVDDAATEMVEGSMTNTMPSAALDWNPVIQERMAYHRALRSEQDGWRLPTKNELLSLFNSGHFPDSMKGKKFWSSTLYQPSPDYAWFVDFFDGLTMPVKLMNNYYVRLVRSGQGIVAGTNSKLNPSSIGGQYEHAY